MRNQVDRLFREFLINLLAGEAAILIFALLLLCSCSTRKVASESVTVIETATTADSLSVVRHAGSEEAFHSSFSALAFDFDSLRVEIKSAVPEALRDTSPMPRRVSIVAYGGTVRKNTDQQQKAVAHYNSVDSVGYKASGARSVVAQTAEKKSYNPPNTVAGIAVLAAILIALYLLYRQLTK